MEHLAAKLESMMNLIYQKTIILIAESYKLIIIF